MTFLTPIALLGLLVLPVLVLLHLRRGRYQLEDVPSTLLWQELIEETQQRSSRLRLRSLPLLLLQLLAVTLLVGSLARPASTVVSARQTSLHVYVIDASAMMAATDLSPNRMAVAKGIVDRGIAQARQGTRFTVVVATEQPYVLVSSADGAQARQAIASLAPTPAQADFLTALRLTAGMLATQRRQGSQITVLHARENPVPALRGAQGILELVALGRSSDNQSILSFSVRCPVDVTIPCTAFAAIRNEDDRAVKDGLIIRGDGDVLARQSLALSARADTELSFPVPQGQHILQMQLTRPDILPLDNVAWTLMGPPQPMRITLVGNPTDTTQLRQALISLPNVAVRELPPRLYSPVQAEHSDLLILDGWRPTGGWPAAPALLFVNPPSLPAGRVGGSLVDATVSGQDPASPLVSGVDLTSLDVPADTAEQVTLPTWVAPVVWAAGGPLLAAGNNGTQRVAVLAFDPATSNLPQLSAFPLLLWNIARWSQGWLPSAVTAGQSVLLEIPPLTSSVQLVNVNPGSPDLPLSTISVAKDQPVTFDPTQPGVYAVMDRGPWGSRRGQVAANADTEPQPATVAVQVSLAGSQTGIVTTVGRELASWWPWIGLVALVTIATEWVYETWREG